MDLPVPPGALWGKLFPRRSPHEAWHPLEDHCADVAAVTEALLALPLIQARLAALAGVDALPERWIARLCAVAFLHDIGKANHRFQRGDGGHIAEAVHVVGDQGRRRTTGLDAVETWAANGRYLLAVALGHHGESPDIDMPAQLGPLWAATAERDPLAGVRRLVDAAQRGWPSAFEAGGPPLPDLWDRAPFWHAFLGLLQIADWLGSDSAKDAFPFSEAGAGLRLDFARASARDLVLRLGLDPAPLRRHLPPALSFAAVSPHPPSPLQEAVADLPGPVVVLEAETGAGKTEAALWRFARLFADGQVDGLYFALPTRVAATAMHARIQSACDRLLGPGRLEVVRALPGNVAAGGAGMRLLPEFGVQWTDDPDEARKRARWAAEGPKRFLAAPVAVGTIDQALLGTVRVKHAQMRSFCLSRSLLVVDEVHASDTYMGSLLEALLQQHVAAGGEALLLSATLGAAARSRLLAPASRRPSIPPLDAAIAMPYPALARGGKDEEEMRSAVGRGHEKSVDVEAVEAIDSPRHVAELAISAARNGAKVLIVRNLVRDAVATLSAIEALAPAHAILFRVDGLGTLHHGRFSAGDRRLLDRAVEACIGRERPDGPLILVGTQTLEQSLDIDADLLVTDLAPIDVLLQRIGRLHRHDRARPSGFSAARALILVPETFDASLEAVAAGGQKLRAGPHGLGGFVYENLLSLVATRRLLGARARWDIPQDNRELVERGTHPEALAALAKELGVSDPRWHRVGMDAAGRDFARKTAARHAAISWQAPAHDFRVEKDENLGTRLGLADREIIFPSPVPGPFSSAPLVERLVLASHLVGDVEAQAEPTDVTPIDGGFQFRFGPRAFLYDRFGLRMRSPQ